MKRAGSVIHDGLVELTIKLVQFQALPVQVKCRGQLVSSHHLIGLFLESLAALSALPELDKCFVFWVNVESLLQMLFAHVPLPIVQEYPTPPK